LLFSAQTLQEDICSLLSDGAVLDLRSQLINYAILGALVLLEALKRLIKVIDFGGLFLQLLLLFLVLLL
jgi:hypothetical protein